MVLNKDAPFCGLNVKFLKVFFFFETPKLLRNSVSALEFFFLLMAECFHFCFFLANEISNKFEQVFFCGGSRDRFAYAVRTGFLCCNAICFAQFWKWLNYALFW